MKKVSLKVFSSILVISVLVGCNPTQKMIDNATGVKYTVKPRILEMHGDEVAVSININYPAKYFNSAVILNLTPVIKSESGETQLKSISVQGDGVQANNKVISFKTGGSLDYSDAVPYEEHMRVSDLILKIEADVKGKKVPFPEVKIADGVITTPQLVEIDPKPVILSDKFMRIKSTTKEADIHYVISQAIVRNSELNQNDIKALKDFLKKVEKAKNLELKKANLSAYASPDGPYDFNDKLSVRRKESAKQYFDREFKKFNEAKAESFYSLKTTAEDWEGFKELVQKSDIQDKDLILRVLSMYTDPVVREKEIKNMSAVYLKLADDILPKLRRSKLQLQVDEVGFSDDELFTYAFSKVDTLNEEELLHAATLTDDLNKKLQIYKNTTKKFPKSLRAHNNVGYVLIKQGKIKEAKSALEKAKGIDASNAVVMNNLGCISLLEGDFKGAKEILTKATNAGDAANYNLGIISIKEGDYESALNYLSSWSNSFNGALTLLLADKRPNAKNILDKMEGAGAKAYYLKAVIGAQEKNGDYLFTNLKLAVSKDPSLKEKAKTDIEFEGFFDDSTFKSIVQ
ncbi:tetratricopeptide repeat protein [Bacteroidota bacterium]